MTGALDILDAALDAFDEQKAAKQRAFFERQAEFKQFVADFSSFRDLVAQPIFEEIGNHLKGRGHTFSIVKGQFQDCPSISLIVTPKGTTPTGNPDGPNPSQPQFRIFANESAKTITFFGAGPSMGRGSRGACSLQSVTAERVRVEAIGCLAEAFSPAKKMG